MNKFSVDYTDLQDKLLKKKAYRLSDVQHRIKKVAFDVVRFVDSDQVDDLWQIQRDGDDEYIVAMYDDSSDDSKVVTSTKIASAPLWTALADRTGESINIFYKNAPITRVVLASMGIVPSEAYLVCQYLPKKLADDSEFRNSFIANLTEGERQALLEEDPSILGK